MNLPPFLSAIFPPKRKAIQLLSLGPLILFLVVFISACLILELGSTMLFSETKAFLLLLAAPWFWWMHHNGYHGLGPARSFAALLTRLLLLGVIILALAEPRAVRKSDVLSVVYALDISDSIGEQATDQALKFVMKTVSEKPEQDEAGLVVFGRNAAVELPPRKSFPFEEVINARITRDGTNLERGLALAAAMLPEENQGRIVLITDGTETDGSVSTVLDSLGSRDIPVDVLPISYDYANEVWLEKLILPRVVKLGETYEAATVLSSLHPGEGKLSLYENGNLIYTNQVKYQSGKNRYVVPIYFRTTGYYEYVMRIETAKEDDGWDNNNIAVSDLYLKGEGKVLLVTDPQGDDRDWTLLIQALKEADQNIETMLSYEFPHDALPLLPYDCIIFPNVPAEAFNAIQFQALHDAIYNQGVGFLMIGGKNSYGPGGYNRTLVEKVLPVSMDVKQKKILPKGALAIILHTCEFPEGNTWGKRIAKEAIRVLNAQDEAGILVYGGGPASGEQWLFPLMPVAAYDKMVPLINSAQIGDMPSFTTTMELGLEGLGASDAAMKHMIIISDGDPSPPTPELLNEFIQDQVSISTISIKPHGGQDIAIMRQIAMQTGGRYYNPKDPNLLPGIFIKEAKTLKRSMIQNKTFIPETSFPSPILKGLEGLPELLGYVITSMKPRATGILVFPDEEEKDPVLSTWRYGLGKSAAFTSDLSPLWGKSWVEWSKYRAFVKQLVTDISKVNQQSSLAVQSFADGNKGVVLIEDHNPEYAHLTLSAEVTLPNRQSTPVRIKQIGPAMYQGEFPLQGQGHYQVMVAAGGRANKPEHGISGFSVPYSPEYLKFRYDPSLLKKIIADTGGRELDGEETGEELFNIDRKTKQRSRPIFDWFLWALAILIPLDVGIRRVQIDWMVIKGWFGSKRKKESMETLSSLLKKKEDVGEQFKEQRKKASPLPKRPMRTTGGERKPPPVPSPSHRPESKETDPSTSDDQPTTTTGRLLAKKKKWKQEDE